MLKNDFMKKNSKKLKIAFFVGIFPVVSESWLVEQIEELLKRGVLIELFVFRKGDMKNIDQKVKDLNLLDKTIFLDFPLPWSERLLKATPLFFKVLFRKPSLFFKIFNKKYGKDAYSLKYLFWVAPLFDKLDKFDLIHCHFGTTGNKFVIIDSILNTKKKLIASFYGLDASMYIKERGKDFYKKLIERANYILPNSDDMRKHLLKNGFNKKRTLVQYLGLDFNKYKFLQREYKVGDIFNIVFVGRFVEKKGIGDLLKSFAFLQKKYSFARLHLIGDGVEKVKIKKIVKDLGIEKFIKFYGFQKHNNVLKILNNDMHLMVQLSKTAKNGDKEGLPYILTEAQALGLPIVSTKHAGIPEEVKENFSSFLVSEGDWQSAFLKIEFFIKNPEKVEIFSLNARKFIKEKFDIKNTIDNLIKIYNLCLKE